MNIRGVILSFGNVRFLQHSKSNLSFKILPVLPFYLNLDFEKCSEKFHLHFISYSWQISVRTNLAMR